MSDNVKIPYNSKDRFILRFHNEGQRAVMKERAASNHRTMNAEILFLIEKGIEAVNSNKG